MNELWIDRLLATHTHTTEDIEALRASARHVRKYAAGQTILFEEDRFDMLYAVISGWIGNTRHLEDGSEQILDIFLPGQLVGLRQLATPQALVGYQALTEAEVCLIDKHCLQESMAERPNLNAAILQATAMEDSWLIEHINTLGHRSAAQSILHFLLEIADRLAQAAGDDLPASSVTLPISQEQLGNILAITPVHVSRVLKELRSQDLVDSSDGAWQFPDRQAAEGFCDYQPKLPQLKG